MSRSNELRELIEEQLKTVCDKVYYKQADSENIYPHIVFSLRSINTGDLNRYDYSLQIELWDNSGRDLNILEMSDAVQALFRKENIPQSEILPTFYSENMKEVDDPDENIRHIQIDVMVQLYERQV